LESQIMPTMPISQTKPQIMKAENSQTIISNMT